MLSRLGVVENRFPPRWHALTAQKSVTGNIVTRKAAQKGRSKRFKVSTTGKGPTTQGRMGTMTQGLTGGEARAATCTRVNRMEPGATVAKTKTGAQLETTKNPTLSKRQIVTATAVQKRATATTLPNIKTAK